MAKFYPPLPAVAQHRTLTPLNPHDQLIDDLGYTHPDLHRRIDPSDPEPDSFETAPRDYIIGIYDDLHSIRQTILTYHDEESSTDDIP